MPYKNLYKTYITFDKHIKTYKKPTFCSSTPSLHPTAPTLPAPQFCIYAKDRTKNDKRRQRGGQTEGQMDRQ